MEGCAGNLHVSHCTPALCLPCEESSSAPQSTKTEVVPKTITSDLQCRYELAPRQQYCVPDAGKHRGTFLCFQSLLLQVKVSKVFLFSVGQSHSELEKLK